MADTLATLTTENNISFKRLEDGKTEVCFIVDKNLGRSIYSIKDALNGAKTDKLTVKVSKYREKRSLDANKYCWVLCQKLAEKQSLTGKIKVTKVDVYQKNIREVGYFEFIPMRNDAVEDYIRHWESRGDGWLCDIKGDSKFKGYKKLQQFFGSSSYDTREMTVLLNAIIADCKEQGIETMTPDELNSLLEAENGRK